MSETTTTINSIIVTHNARIRCFLKQFLKKMYNVNGVDKAFSEIRLANCAILKVSLQKSNNKILSSIDLIYSGEIDPKESKKGYIYFAPKQINGQDTPDVAKMKLTTTTTVFDTINQIIEYEQLNNVLQIDASKLMENVQYSFYLIRHGQATHNLYSKIGKIFNSPMNKDTRLTAPTGINQAFAAGRWFLQYAMDNRIDINNCNLFVSDLTRTRETVTNFIKSFQFKIQNNGVLKAVVVLPCAHELIYSSDKNSNCDGAASGKTGNIAGENRMNCSRESIANCGKYGSTDTCCGSTFGNGFKLSFDWRMYTDFYGKGSRDEPGNNRRHCRDTNMIAEALRYLAATNNNQSINQSINPSINQTNYPIISNNQMIDRYSVDSRMSVDRNGDRNSAYGMAGYDYSTILKQGGRNKSRRNKSRRNKSRSNKSRRNKSRRNNN